MERCGVFIEVRTEFLINISFGFKGLISEPGKNVESTYEHFDP
jgi:hypothetical protein